MKMMSGYSKILDSMGQVLRQTWGVYSGRVFEAKDNAFNAAY